MKNTVEVADKLRASAASESGHTDDDWQVLGRTAQVTIPWGPEMAEVYGQAIGGDQAAKGGEADVSLIDQAQGFRVWCENLVSGVPGEMLCAETALLGVHHASTSVENRRIVSMASRLEAIFLRRCAESFDSNEALEVYGAFQRVLAPAIGVMVEAYMDAILAGMADIGMNERLVARIRNVAIRRMIDKAREVLPVMDWSDALSVGFTSIDSQHKRLVALLNSLHDSGVKGGQRRPRQDLGRADRLHGGALRARGEAHGRARLPRASRCTRRPTSRWFLKSRSSTRTSSPAAPFSARSY